MANAERHIMIGRRKAPYRRALHHEATETSVSLLMTSRLREKKIKR